MFLCEGKLLTIKSSKNRDGECKLSSEKQAFLRQHGLLEVGVIMMNSKRFIMVIVLIVALGAGGIYLNQTFTSATSELENSQASISKGQQPNSSAELSDEEMVEKLSKTLKVIQEQYVEEVDEQELLEGAIEGMLRSLNNPYSVYMDQKKRRINLWSLWALILKELGQK